MTNRVQWEDLDIEQKLIVLGWIREVLNTGMKRTVQSKAYAKFTQVVNGKVDCFDYAEIWSELPETTTQHFQHEAGILLDLDAEIISLEDQLEEEEKESETPIESDIEIEPEVLPNYPDETESRE